VGKLAQMLSFQFLRRPANALTSDTECQCPAQPARPLPHFDALGQ
jgi:hypothetical protein